MGELRKGWNIAKRETGVKELLDKYYSILCYDEVEEYEGIIAFLSEYILNCPDNPIAFHNRGVAYWETGRMDEAMNDFDCSIELLGKSPVPFFSRGELFKKLGKFEEAEKDFNRGVEIEPANASSYRIRAGFYDERRRFESAIEDYSRAIELEPEFPYTYKLRGEAYRELGEVECYEKDIASWKEAEYAKQKKQEAKVALAEGFVCPDTGEPFGKNAYIGEWGVDDSGNSGGPLLREGKHYYKMKWDGTLFLRGF